MSKEQSIIGNEELSSQQRSEGEISFSDQTPAQQISLKRQKDLIMVTLPPENEPEDFPWDQIIQQFQSHLQGMEKEWPPETKVNLLAHKRLLDSQKLQTIASVLLEVNLKLNLIVTSRRQTAVAAASAGYSVQQESVAKPLIKKNHTQQQLLVDPLYLKNTIRSGTEIRHDGTVIVLGDVNPGGAIIARGDVLIWGNLRGIAHAGAWGNRKSLIMALKMDPTQLRIAEMVATSPENLPPDFEPEVAYISHQGIKITSAVNFSKHNFFSEKVKIWKDSKNQGLI